MNNFYSSNRRLIFMNVVSMLFATVISDQVFAGKEEEFTARKRQIESQVLANIKASIVGGPQTAENKLALSTLKAAQEEQKFLSHIPALPLEIKYIILGLSSPNNECVNKLHRQLTVRDRKTFKALTNLPLQTQLKTYLQANGKGLLENIDLSDSKVTNEDIAWIALHFPNLTSLDLQGTRIKDEGLQHVSGLKSLTSLNLRNNELRDKSLRHVVGLKSLTSLNLRNNQFGDEGLQHVSGLKSLTSLNLRSTDVTGVGLQHVSGLKSLASLNLKGIQVENAGLAHVAKLKSLTNLNLGMTSITDAQLAHVAGLNHLTSLDLHGTLVTDAGLAHIAGLTNLTSLNLGGTQVTDAGLQQLPLRLR